MDIKTISMHSTLPELGMDSMIAVEIKQFLEREKEVFLTPSDIRSLTFARFVPQHTVYFLFLLIKESNGFLCKCVLKKQH